MALPNAQQRRLHVYSINSPFTSVDTDKNLNKFNKVFVVPSRLPLLIWGMNRPVRCAISPCLPNKFIPGLSNARDFHLGHLLAATKQLILLNVGYTHPNADQGRGNLVKQVKGMGIARLDNHVIVSNSNLIDGGNGNTITI